MGDQYGFPDIRQLMAGRTHFSPPIEPLSGHRNLAPQSQYESFMVGGFFPRGMADFGQECSMSATATTIAGSGGGAGLCGVDMESGYFGNDGGNSRWRRQETLTLLEIRSQLDSKFREANHKGPLWEEVSRIMSEDNGYQRSGKKCREKFENLYKYYKKTKVGKGGRQDGRNYRFFRQLEEIYGDTSNTNQASSISEPHRNSSRFKNISNTSNLESTEEPKLSGSLSFSNSWEIETSSCSESYNDDLSAIASKINQSMESDRRGRKSWKVKAKEYIQMEMRKLMERQETWMKRMLKTIELKEEERMYKEEEWRKQETARCDREHGIWAKKRAWIEARDVALMETLKKLAGKGLELPSYFYSDPFAGEAQSINIKNGNEVHHDSVMDRDHNEWTETEISSLVQLRSNYGRESWYLHEGIWEEISEKMGNMGYDRSTVECKEKWENIRSYINMATDCGKKMKEDLRTSNYFPQFLPNQGEEITKQGSRDIPQMENDVFMTSQLNDVSQVHDTSCFNMMNEGEFWWQKYGFKVNKGKNQQE